MSRLRYSLLLILLISATIFAKEEPRKIALVIGNADYSNIKDFDSLPMPINDANGMVDSLRKFGYKLTTNEAVINAGYSKMDSILNKFYNECRNCTDINDTIIFYYSGHGYYNQHEDKHEIVLVDEFPTNHPLILENIIINITKVSNANIVVIYDACRNTMNGLTDNNNAPQRTDCQNYGNQVTVYYACQKGCKAYPTKEDNNHSRFTRALLSSWTINDVFPDVYQRASDIIQGKTNDISPSTHPQSQWHFSPSMGLNIPTPLELKLGIDNGNFFCDVFFANALKKTNEVYIYDKVDWNCIGNMKYSHYSAGARFGYLWNLGQEEKWKLGPYLKFGNEIFKGNNSDVAGNGVNILHLSIGAQLEYEIIKWLSLYANCEVKTPITKNPNENFEIIKTSCKEINSWSKPVLLGASIGLKFNILLK